MTAPSRLPHRRALDGVRGAAVVAVLLFHGGKLKGGYLGVDLFFVLSGYLITSLLLAEARSDGTVNLLGFWARRARRLLPALFLVLAFVGLYALVIADPTELRRIRGDAFTTLAYVANWRFVFGHFDYFALFSSPSPLNHTWSLAIEEQFYVVWPLVFAVVLWWGHRAGRRRDASSDTIARVIFVVSLLLAAAFAAFALGSWRWYQDATRIYYGTDTRAPAILLGAALGALLALRGPARSRRARIMVEISAVVGVGVLAVAWSRLAGVNLYRGGLLACGVAGVAVVAAAAHPQPGLLARVLSFGPLVGLGLISYGVYLWHWPIYLWLDAGRVGVAGWPLLAVRIAVTFTIAIASYVLVEQPIRRGAFTPTTLRWLTPLAAVALIAVTLISTAGYQKPFSAASEGLNNPAAAARRARTHPGAQRLMVAGNSVAYFLAGEGFSKLQTNPKIVTLNAGMAACVYPDGERLRIDNTSRGWSPVPCDQGWQTAVDEFRPDVVLMTFSDSGAGQLLHDGQWLTSCSPAYRTWYLQTLEDATRLHTARGARVVMTTAPYSLVYGATDASRDQTDCTNALTREFAAAHPAVRLVDLARFLCPTHTTCRTTLDGVTLRKDGTHYRGRSARLIARWLLPQLGIEAAEGSRSSAPTPDRSPIPSQQP